ncbi:MAG: methyltransferase domain-containing protein [Polyangiaceae bacterium]|nr:methyltransferase domain-containing protein [Polyangiaceae bacterium]
MADLPQSARRGSPYVYPSWLGNLVACPVRRLVHEPGPVVAPFVGPGMTVLEPGPGNGYFTLELARRVGASGRVVAAELEPQLLVALGRRLRRAGLLGSVELRQSPRHRLGVTDLANQVDFALAFATVHELPDAEAFFGEVAPTLTGEGRLLLAEPRGHVSAADFESMLAAARRTGLEVVGHLRISWCRAVTLRRLA